MINADFYPTPRPLIEKMLQGVQIGHLSSVLEPSAGKGDIADFLQVRYKHRASYGATLDIDVVEIEPDLQLILQGKEYHLVHDDFLTFETQKRYDLIIGNFPFSNDEAHLEHALNLIENNGGQLICLVAGNTLRILDTNKRRALATRLERLNATIEFIPHAFLKAERPTDIEVALVKVQVEATPHISILLDKLREAETLHLGDTTPTAIALTDFQDKLLSCFQQEAKLGVNLIREYWACKPYILQRIYKPEEEDAKRYATPLIELRVGEKTPRSINELVNCYLKALRLKYWSLLLNDHHFTVRYTSNILNELQKKLKELQHYDFTGFNISMLERDLNTKINQGIEDAILELFDTFSRRFWQSEDSGNIHYYNGWKTNKAHKINNKVIIPMNGFNAYGYKGARLDGYVQEKLRDMLKVFNYLAVGHRGSLQLVTNQLESAEVRDDYRNIDLRYFTVTFFKKGTAHIVFQDKELLAKFNIFGSQRKGWLPPAYGKKSYRDMTPEEKIVVDDFQGKAEYADVMANPGYFLVPENSLYQLTAGEQKPLAEPQPALW